MRRRDAIGLFATSAVTWTFTSFYALGQRAGRIKRLGILQPGAPPDALVDAMRDRLRELGHLEGRDLIIEYRSAEGKLDRLADLASELVSWKPDVITTLSTPAALAAKSATTTIPIVFTAVGDPLGAGLVPDLARPGGNITGISLLATELAGKRLEILREMAPNTSPVVMLWNDTNPGMVLRAQETRNAAAKLGVMVESTGVHDLVSFETAFSAIEGGRGNALVVLIDPFTRQHRQRIIEFAQRRHLPAIYEAREFVEAGGLASYGPSFMAIQRRAAEYIDKIFKGEARRSSRRAAFQI